jgi:hypothetical protein
MAQSLRALYSQPPADAYPTGPLPGRKSYIDASQPPSITYVPRGYVITQTPKRPQAQRPVYLDSNPRPGQQVPETISPVVPATPQVQSHRIEESTQPLAAIPGKRMQSSRPIQLSQSMQPSQPMLISRPLPPVQETRAVEIWTPPDRRSPWNTITEWFRRLGLHS